MNPISNININGIISKLKDHAEQFRGTDLEKKVKDATSNANWGVTFQIKEEIVRSTYDYQSYNQIMSIIWKRMGESGKNWKMVFKSLDLLEYLLKRGSERVIAEAQGRQYQIRTLRDFHYSESDGRDKGGGIREKSRAICELLNDKATLDAERAKARAQVGKYMGISHYDTFSSNTHRTSAQYDADYTFRDQNKTASDQADSASGKKKKKKKKKKEPKPEDDLSDDFLSASDDDSQRPSRVEYHIPEPPGPGKGQSNRKKKKDKPKHRADDASATEPSLIPDFFAESFPESNLSPQPAQNLAPSDPLSAFDFSTSAFPAAPQPNSRPFDAFFVGSQQLAVHGFQSPSAGPFQDIFQTPPPAKPSNSAFQQPPSFTPAPLFSQPPQQQSMFSPSALPAQNSMFASPGAVNFSSQQQAQAAAESDNDDWGFVSANSTPKPQAQIDFFGTPTKPAEARNDFAWNDFSTLSISSPPQHQPERRRTEAQSPPQAESVFTGFDFPPSQPPANKQNDLSSFF